MLKAHEHDRSNFEEIIKGEKCIQQKTVINDLNWNDGEKSKQKFFDCIKCPIQIVEDDYEVSQILKIDFIARFDFNIHNFLSLTKRNICNRI